jgi:hypothetical protein
MLGIGSNCQVLTACSGETTGAKWACVSGGGCARSVAGDTDNGIITWVTSDNTFAAEAGLLYDATTLTVTKDADSEVVGLKLINESDSANTAGFISLGFDLEDTGGNAVDSGKIAVKKEASFTATAATQDSSMEFHTSLNGTLAEKMTLNSAGNLCVGGDLTVTGGCITLAGSLIFSGGDTTSLNLIDAIDATTEATIETAIDTLSNLTETGALDAGSITSGFGTIDTGSSAVTTTGLITGGTFSTGNSGTAKFLDGDGSHYFTLAAHATTTASVGYTWPAADGSCGQVLSTNSSGVLSWAAAGGGAVSAINNATANELVTIGATTTELCAEANLTFNGTSLIFTSANDAGDNVISVINTSNTTSDGAYVDIQSGGNAAGNAYVHFDANSEWSVGVDRNQQRFAISYNACGAKPGNTDILTIEQTGKISFQVSCQEFAMSGNEITELAGVNFLTSQSASANANTMDDYEEGTWAPRFMDADRDGDDQSVSYGTRVARYIKIGKMVWANFKLEITNLGSLTTGDIAHVGGLPFTSENTTDNMSGGSVVGSSSLNIAAGYNITLEQTYNTDWMYINLWDSAAGVSIMLVSELSTDASIRGQVFYRASA